MNTEQMIANY